MANLNTGPSAAYLFQELHALIQQHGEIDRVDNLDQTLLFRSAEFGDVDIFISLGLKDGSITIKFDDRSKTTTLARFDSGGAAEPRDQSVLERVALVLKAAKAFVDAPTPILASCSPQVAIANAQPIYTGAKPPLESDSEVEFEMFSENWSIVRPPGVFRFGGYNGTLYGVAFSSEIPGALVFQINFDFLADGRHAGSGIDGLKNMLDQAFSKSGENLKSMRFFLGGMCQAKLMESTVEQDRIKIIHELRQFGLIESQIFFRWVDNPELLQSIIVDPRDGSVCYQEIMSPHEEAN